MNIYDQKEESVRRANDVYNQLVNESRNLTNTQSNYIDNHIEENTNRINQSVNNNVANLDAANRKLESDYNRELEGSQKDYNQVTSAPISETARIAAQNAMQNRAQTARESREQAYQEYLNQSKQARITGDSTIAQVALESLKEKLNLKSAMSSYNADLMKNKLQNERNIDNSYWANQKAYYSAENDYNKYLENQRQFDETLAYEKAQDAIENAMKEKEYQLAAQKAQNNYYSRSSGGASGSYGALTDGNNWINTDYYYGPINSDYRYGVFNTKDKNGVKYQPNNVGGSPLSKTGYTVNNNGVVQNIWMDERGRYYYWEGRQNKYIQIGNTLSDVAKKAISTGTKVINR